MPACRFDAARFACRSSRMFRSIELRKHTQAPSVKSRAESTSATRVVFVLGLACNPNLALTLCANQHESHQRRLLAAIAPSMPSAVLNHHVVFLQMRYLSIVELEGDLAIEDDPVVDRIGRMH